MDGQGSFEKQQHNNGHYPTLIPALETIHLVISASLLPQ
jgi:hypothetical protein